MPTSIRAVTPARRGRHGCRPMSAGSARRTLALMPFAMVKPHGPPSRLPAHRSATHKSYRNDEPRRRQATFDMIAIRRASAGQPSQRKGRKGTKGRSIPSQSSRSGSASAKSPGTLTISSGKRRPTKNQPRPIPTRKLTRSPGRRRRIIMTSIGGMAEARRNPSSQCIIMRPWSIADGYPRKPVRIIAYRPKRNGNGRAGRVRRPRSASATTRPSSATMRESRRTPTICRTQSARRRRIRGAFTTCTATSRVVLDQYDAKFYGSLGLDKATLLPIKTAGQSPLQPRRARRRGSRRAGRGSARAFLRHRPAEEGSADSTEYLVEQRRLGRLASCGRGMSR